MLKLIAGKCENVVEIDMESLNGISRSARVKVKIDLRKLLKLGLNLKAKNSKHMWVTFKYERLPSFFYYCGLLGHMKRDCDLVEGEENEINVADDKLPFGEWLRASPGKTVTISSMARCGNTDKSSLRRQLFERFKESVRTENKHHDHEGDDQGMQIQAEKLEITVVRSNLERVLVNT
ncbi:hypothetical protein ACS0TY_018227 [Phlomoides rotata]